MTVSLGEGALFELVLEVIRVLGRVSQALPAFCLTVLECPSLEELAFLSSRTPNVLLCLLFLIEAVGICLFFLFNQVEMSMPVISNIE